MWVSLTILKGNPPKIPCLIMPDHDFPLIGMVMSCYFKVQTIFRHSHVALRFGHSSWDHFGEFWGSQGAISWAIKDTLFSNLVLLVGRFPYYGLSESTRVAMAQWCSMAQAISGDRLWLRCGWRQNTPWADLCWSMTPRQVVIVTDIPLSAVWTAMLQWIKRREVRLQ